MRKRTNNYKTKAGAQAVARKIHANWQSYYTVLQGADGLWYISPDTSRAAEALALYFSGN